MAAIRFDDWMGTHGCVMPSISCVSRGRGTLCRCRQDPLRGTTFAREHNVRYYREYVYLLGDRKVETVLVVTPPRLHERICTRRSRLVRPCWSKSPWLHDTRGD